MTPAISSERTPLATYGNPAITAGMERPSIDCKSLSKSFFLSGETSAGKSEVAIAKPDSRCTRSFEEEKELAKLSSDLTDSASSRTAVSNDRACRAVGNVLPQRSEAAEL